MNALLTWLASIPAVRRFTDRWPRLRQRIDRFLARFDNDDEAGA
jgi:hypothetical protein